MTIGYADLPRPIRSGLVLVDPRQATTGESGDRSEALRLTAPATETWQFDADIDAGR